MSAYNRFNANADRRFNRLASLAGFGQTANNSTAQSGSNYANQVGQNLMGAGNAQAAAQIAQGNMLNNAMNTGMNSWMLYQLGNK